MSPFQVLSLYMVNEHTFQKANKSLKNIFLLVLWSILIYWDAPVHKYHRSSQTSSARIRYKTLYINFASNVNILNCVQAEIRCFRCAKSTHTRFVCTSIITEKCTTAVCHYNRLYLDYNRHSSKPCNTGFFYPTESCSLRIICSCSGRVFWAAVQSVFHTAQWEKAWAVLHYMRHWFINFVVFTLCGFWSIHFGGPLHFHCKTHRVSL